jgi:chemotaxis protein methyltransferase CheR
VENLTVNETSFFRNRPQLDLFQKYILEDMLHHKQERRDWNLRLWSAGCSTGQEPYTLAMMVCDALAYYYLRNPLPFEMPVPKPLIPPPWKVEILASDINYTVLRAAQEAIYTEIQMEAVDYSARLRYFDRIGERYAVKRSLKDLVHFDFHNLKTEFLPQRNDIIFCRNVMIYFDEAEQKRLVEKLHRCLNPDGFLFIGHAESLFGLSEKFRMIHQNNGTAYQRQEVKV